MCLEQLPLPIWLGCCCKKYFMELWLFESIQELSIPSHLLYQLFIVFQWPLHVMWPEQSHDNKWPCICMRLPIPVGWCFPFPELASLLSRWPWHSLSSDSTRLFHNPRLVAVGLSVGYGAWPSTGWHHPFMIGSCKYRFGLPGVTMLGGLVGIADATVSVSSEMVLRSDCVKFFSDLPVWNFYK